MGRPNAQKASTASRQVRLRTRPIAAITATLAATLAVPCFAADDVLVHPFAFGPGGQWTPVHLRWDASQWRVGDPRGPVATGPQLQAFLRSLTAIEIGGRCAGWVLGATIYPCSVMVDVASPAGAVDSASPTLHAAWQPPAGLAERSAQAASESTRGALGEMQFVAVRIEAGGFELTDPLRQATMVFSVRAGTSAIATNRFELDSGLVILRRAAPSPQDGRSRSPAMRSL